MEDALNAPVPSAFAVGKRFSREHRFGTADAIAFATAAGDDNPLHHDADFAAASRYGRLIVSGTQTSALLLGLTAAHFSKIGSVVGVGYTLAFKRPVYMEDRVFIEWTIESTRPASSGSGLLVNMRGSVRNEAGEVCVEATGTVMAFGSQLGRDGG